MAASEPMYDSVKEHSFTRKIYTEGTFCESLSDSQRRGLGLAFSMQANSQAYAVDCLVEAPISRWEVRYGDVSDPGCR